MIAEYKSVQNYESCCVSNQIINDDLHIELIFGVKIIIIPVTANGKRLHRLPKLFVHSLQDLILLLSSLITSTNN